MMAEINGGARGAAAPDGIATDYAELEPAAREVLDFWFGAPGSPRFGQEWNRWFAQIPAAGDYGTQKLFVFRKR